MAFYLCSDHYPECPLGLKCNYQSNYREPGWWNCPNRYYCQGVTEAWSLPIQKFSANDDFNRAEVELFPPPHNYSFKYYCQYMRDYGYAEAEPLPYRRGEDSWEVITNKISAGYAMSVSLEKLNRITWSGYKKDDCGIWWHGDRKTLRKIWNKYQLNRQERLSEASAVGEGFSR